MLHEKHPARLIFFAFLILCAVVIAARAETQKLTTTVGLQKVLAAAVAKAEEIGVPMGIAVVDAGANLVGFIKMDGLSSTPITPPRPRPIAPLRYVGPCTRAAYPLR